jgi:hypothetical protein
MLISWTLPSNTGSGRQDPADIQFFQVISVLNPLSIFYLIEYLFMSTCAHLDFFLVDFVCRLWLVGVGDVGKQVLRASNSSFLDSVTVLYHLPTPVGATVATLQYSVIDLDRKPGVTYFYRVSVRNAACGKFPLALPVGECGPRCQGPGLYSLRSPKFSCLDSVQHRSSNAASYRRVCGYTRLLTCSRSEQCGIRRVISILCCPTNNTAMKRLRPADSSSLRGGLHERL